MVLIYNWHGSQITFYQTAGYFAKTAGSLTYFAKNRTGRYSEIG
jgi:hypothetical protein